VHCLVRRSGNLSHIKHVTALVTFHEPPRRAAGGTGSGTLVALAARGWYTGKRWLRYVAARSALGAPPDSNRPTVAQPTIVPPRRTIRQLGVRYNKGRQNP